MSVREKLLLLQGPVRGLPRRLPRGPPGEGPLLRDLRRDGAARRGRRAPRRPDIPHLRQGR